MTWGRLDDSFYSHPKVLQAWNEDRASIGLHALALAWVANHEQDGKVPPHVVAMLMPDQPDRDRAVATLVDVGLWHENGAGYVIHDYLDYNPSREYLEQRREADRDRKAGARG